MSENDPQLDQLDNAGTPPAEPSVDDAKADAAEANAGTGRFAVYDRDELRYRGRVHDTRKTADDAKAALSKPKRIRRGRFEIREV